VARAQRTQVGRQNSHGGGRRAPDSGEELEEAVAALNVQAKRNQPKKKPAKGNKAKEKLCYKHKKFGNQAWECADPATCSWERAEN